MAEERTETRVVVDGHTLTLVNLNPVEARTVILQAGAYAEHQFAEAAADSRSVSVDRSWMTVRLAPGAGSRLTIGLKPWLPASDVTSTNGTLVAAGPLARALDTQLASNQPADAGVRIGLSFRDKQGRLCRSFEGAALSGIGCREDGRWALERALRGEGRRDYRQASSGALAADVAAMLAGDPFDAAAERAARDRGWSD